MILDELSAHLTAAGSIERAAVPLGFFAAWCGQLQLFDAAFQQANERNLVRLRLRDLSPAEFLTTSCHGVLDSEWLEPVGRAFAETYYARYAEDLAETFGADVYEVADDWAHYDEIAPLLTRRLMAFRDGKAKRSGERRWWQLWRS